MAHTLRDLLPPLAQFKLKAIIEGDPDTRIVGVATLEDARPDEISFLSNAKYEKQLTTTRAGAVIVSESQSVPVGRTVIRVADPYAAVTILMVFLHGYRKHPHTGVDAGAYIDSTAKIGENANIHHHVTIGKDVVIGRNAVIYPGCHISPNCRIGDDVLLYPNVVIYDGSVLGDRVTIHANSVIGEDGLGYAPHEGRWHKIPQIGYVEIGNDVEIGANCSIDRATLGKTVIGAGSKFSNQIAIGHGTKVGRNCMLVAQVGIAGSVTVGNHVTMAGKVGVAGHLNIGDNAQLGAMAGVMNDVPPDTAVAGAPAIPIKDALRSFAFTARLPEMYKQLKEIENRLEALRKSASAEIK